MHNVRQWYSHVTTTAMKIQQCILCTVELHTSLLTTQIECFHSEATMCSLYMTEAHVAVKNTELLCVAMAPQ